MFNLRFSAFGVSATISASAQAEETEITSFQSRVENIISTSRLWYSDLITNFWKSLLLVILLSSIIMFVLVTAAFQTMHVHINDNNFWYFLSAATLLVSVIGWKIPTLMSPLTFAVGQSKRRAERAKTIRKWVGTTLAGAIFAAILKFLWPF